MLSSKSTHLQASYKSFSSKTSITRTAKIGPIFASRPICVWKNSPIFFGRMAKIGPIFAVRVIDT
jgi:hypothetical protein